MTFSVKYLIKPMLTIFTATTLLSASLFAKEPTQAERNAMAAKLIPIITMLLMEDEDNTTGGTTTTTTGLLKKTGQTTIYYTYDDGYYEKGVTPSYTRNDNTQVVTDHITGLEWQDNLETKTVIKTWSEAQGYCSALGLDGGGWRLPTIQELQSIVVDGAYNPSIDTTAFVNYSTSYYYWSSTTGANSTSYAWVVHFNDGYTGGDYKSNTYYVRCVRQDNKCG